MSFHKKIIINQLIFTAIMIKFKSWRWSRFTERSAYKRLSERPVWIIPLVLFIFSLLLADWKMFCLSEETVCCWLLLVILGITVFMNICCADEYYEIKSGKETIRKVYLYRPAYFQLGLITMVIRDKKSVIRKEIEWDYDFYEGDDASSFRFQIDGYHYYCSPVSNWEVLGHCQLSPTVYAKPNQIGHVTVLHHHGTTRMGADVFFVNNVYVPPLAAKDIRDLLTNEQLDEPRDYMIAKREGQYTVYGLYYGYGQLPFCQKLVIPFVIFKEGNQDIILKWVEEEGYIEMHRIQNSVVRSVSDVFVTMTVHSNSATGKVIKFNEELNVLKLLYQGPFYAIDFDSGAVVGDGYDYNP